MDLPNNNNNDENVNSFVANIQDKNNDDDTMKKDEENNNPIPNQNNNNNEGEKQPSNTTNNCWCCCCPRRYCCLLWCLVIFLPILVIISFLSISMTIGYKRDKPFLQASDGNNNDSIGYPVWSNDDTSNSIAGVEMQYSTGIIFPPLQGWIGKVNPKAKVFIQELHPTEDQQEPPLSSAKRNYVLQFKKQHVMSLFYMKRQNYMLINLLEQPWEFRTTAIAILDNGMDNKKNTAMKPISIDLLSNVGLGMDRASYISIPSRDGSVIAGISWEYDSNVVVVVLVHISIIKEQEENDNQYKFTVSSSEILRVPLDDHGEDAYYTTSFFWEDYPSNNEENNNTLVIMQDAMKEGTFYPSVTHARINAVDSSITFSKATTEIVKNCTNISPSVTSSGRVRVSDGAFVDVNTTSNDIVVIMKNNNLTTTEWKNNCTTSI